MPLPQVLQQLSVFFIKTNINHLAKNGQTFFLKYHLIGVK